MRPACGYRHKEHILGSLALIAWLNFIRLVGRLISWLMWWMFAWSSKGPMIVWLFDDGKREKESETVWQLNNPQEAKKPASSKYWSRWPRKAFHGWTRICRPGTVQTVVQEVPLVLRSMMRSRICTRKIHQAKVRTLLYHPLPIPTTLLIRNDSPNEECPWVVESTRLHPNDRIYTQKLGTPEWFGVIDLPRALPC